jgi:RNase adapter protein RapZ
MARAGALEGDEVSPRRAGRPAPQSGRGRFVVLTGQSGAGKSQAIRALEDLGYFCVDNLPTQLVPTLAALSRREGAVLPKVALVIDVREGGFLREFPRVWRQLKTTPGLDPALIFLEASHETLVRRFSETRRPHPLAHGRPVVEGIRAERRQLQKIRALADEIIDTTHLTVHQLRERFQAFAQVRGAARHLLVTLLSFGFKFGVPLDADIVLDVRFLPNPHFVPALKPRTGKDRAVVTFLRQQPITDQFLAKLVDLLRFLVPEYVREGKAYLTVAIGCTGGRHRSVMIAEALRRSLDDLKDVQIRVRHRDVEQPT